MPRERFDRDLSTGRKIRLNDESAAKFNAAYRKRARALSFSLALFPLSFAREFARSRISPTQLRKRSLTPKAFKRIKFSRIVYDKMFPFNLSNHRRALQTFANLTGERD